MNNFDCPPCKGHCDKGIYCRDLERAKHIIRQAINGYYSEWSQVEWALQVTGDLPSAHQIKKEAVLLETSE